MLKVHVVILFLRTVKIDWTWFGLRRSDLDHFYDEDERDWERDEDEEERDDGHEESADPGPLLTSRLACNTFSLLCRITEAEFPVLTWLVGKVLPTLGFHVIGIFQLKIFR